MDSCVGSVSDDRPTLDAAYVQEAIRVLGSMDVNEMTVTDIDVERRARELAEKDWTTWDELTEMIYDALVFG